VTIETAVINKTTKYRTQNNTSKWRCQL